MSETIKASECDWVADFAEKKGETKRGGDENKIGWMKFSKPGKYQIRLVGRGVKCLKYYKPFEKTRVITHKDYKDEDPAWQAGFYPNDTFANHIIDRADGKLKILEKGKGLFKHFAEYQTVNDVNPAGKNGPDFVITVEWPNGDSKLAKYSATATAKLTPFTEEEKKMIAASFTERDMKVAKEADTDPLLYRLKNIYQTTELEKIKELWENLPTAAKTPPKREKKGYNNAVVETASAPVTQPKIEEPVSSVEPELESESAGSDDLFGDDDKNDIPF